MRAPYNVICIIILTCPADLIIKRDKWDKRLNENGTNALMGMDKTSDKSYDKTIDKDNDIFSYKITINF